jgi:hypothetical protein
MKCNRPLWSVFFLLCATAAHAELYKWVGPDGKISYSDIPPPSSAKHVETKSVSTESVNPASFPYELSEAVKNNPVTLYTTANCAPCDEGRALLSGRGIPFTEKTVNSKDDIAQFKKVSSDDRLPFLLVGRTKEQGFDSSAWNSALTAARYPEARILPKNYRNPAAEAAAAAPKAVTSAQARQASGESPASGPGTAELPAPAGNAPPGFRF